MKGYRKECVISPLFKLFEAILELLVPLFIADIIDTGIATGDKTYVLQKCLILVLLAALGLACSLTAQYFAAKAAVGFSTRINHELFKHIQKFSYTELDTLGTSTLITRMTSDTNQVQNGVNLTLRLLLRSPFVVFGAMIMAFTVSVKAAMIFVVAIPVLAIFIFAILFATIPLYKKVQSKLDSVLGKTRENLTGARVIRAFASEENEIEGYKKSTNELNHAQIFVGKISAFMNPITYVIINIAIVFLIWSGAVQVNAGTLTQGQVIALYNYMSQILVELIKLANFIITITKALASANRIQSVFEMKPSMEQTSTPSCGTESDYVVEFNHVSLKYKNASQSSLTDIDFKVKPGEMVGIIGGTGSGKTSLVNLIPRFYDTCDGEVLVDGVNVKDYSNDTLLNKIGVVPQRAVLFKGTIRDNIKWGKNDSSDEEIMEAIDISQAKDVIDSKNEKLDYVVEQGGKNLSGGQRQRLTIARALVKKPEILILDDSASALDYETDSKLRSSISNLKYKPTVFIVSQRTASIMNTDKIIVLDDGAIVGIGKHDQLLDTCDVYKEIYYSQFKKEEVVS